ncbi:MAG: hypothetical protein GX845_02350 [Erysipelothrix sp.]|nr:hypothetical protein [Erysipelothrix sp.]
MKKLLSMLLLLMLLVGCANATVQVSNPKETVIIVGDSEFSKATVFNLMKNQDPASVIVEIAKQKITNKEMPIDANIRKAADEELESIKEIFGESFDSTLSMYGFESEADYIEKALLPNIQQEALAKQFIRENDELIVITYDPKQVRIAEFANEEKATAAIQALQAGESFEDVVDELSSSVIYQGELQLIHNESSAPASVKQFIAQATVPTLSSLPLESDGDEKAYVVQVVEVNTTRFFDDIVEALSPLSSVSEMMFVNYFKEGNFNVYDKLIHDALKENYSEYLPNR